MTTTRNPGNLRQFLKLCAAAFLLAFALPLSAADQLVWQLGQKNDSGTDFSPQYNAWEYGNAPDIQKSPAMDHATHTYRYTIEKNGEIPRPQVVSGLATESEHAWMHGDEMVSGLELTWNEAAPGTRRIVFDLIHWNYGKDRDGLELSLPDGGRKILNPPEKTTGLEAVFPVKAGKNSLTLRIVSNAKHYKFQFDRIALYATDAPADQLPPVLNCRFDAEDGIYHPGDQVTLNFTAFNLSGGNGEVNYSVEDAFGQKVAAGKTALADSTGKVTLPAAARGYFKVDCKLGPATVTAAYVVIEPVQAEDLPDSRFGCHALDTDSYRLRNWPENQETDMRRAFLAGARWVRYHSMHWFLREPEKGKYDWAYFDERLALAEKYKMNVLLTVLGTPRWASTSDNTKMTSCGAYFYQFYPPKNWPDWADFLGAVVSRYKGRIKWYELANEPGYSSAFWTCGSPEAYGMLLKTGYEAAKKADPSCVILPGAPLPPPNFLEEAVKSAGGKLYFDVMSFHYAGNDRRGSKLVSEWRTALAQMGAADMPLVNTEEMSWRMPGAPAIDTASRLVKVYVREAALGVAKTFAFDLFHTGSSFDASAFDIDGRPLPLYAAYRTMTHRLEHAKFVADLSTPDVEAYLFDRQGSAVTVLWSDKKPRFDLPVGTGSATRIDLMDREFPASAIDGKLALELSELPQFVEGGDLELLTACGKIMKALPHEPVVKPGDTVPYSLEIEKSGTGLKLELPEKWNGSITPNLLKLFVPAGTPEGVYDAAVSATLKGCRITVPFTVEVSTGNRGANLIKNGDFAQSYAHWFFPTDKDKFDAVKGGGLDGSDAVRTRGEVFFGPAGGKIKVRHGERYLLLAEAKGTGLIGGVYSLSDKNGKQVYPPSPGIDCLVGKLGPEWKTFSEEICVTQPDAAILSLSMIANYGDKTGKEAFFNRIAVIRLTDRFPRSKALWQGVCVRAAAEPKDWNAIPPMTVDRESEVVSGKDVSWSGPDDLSAACRMAMDARFLYLDFKVKDDVSCPPKAGQEDVWENDSLQFSFDPLLEGRDRTEIAISQDASGTLRAYKLNGFWTPELPENLTRHGEMPDVKVTVQPIPGGREYRIAIPLRELYPLTAKTGEFGFSWLVNDNDGAGRKYIQWSSGIGPDKNSSLFGIVRCRKP